MKILLGGGLTPKKGFINIDIQKLPTVDMVADISKGIPIEDNSVDEVIADYFLQSLPDLIFVMEEIYRVCKDGAKVRIKVPYFKSTAACKDPTTRFFFTERTFEQFDHMYVEKGLLPEYNLKCNFKTEKVTFNYYTRGTKYLPFVNLLRRFLWDIVKNIVVELRVVKNK